MTSIEGRGGSTWLELFAAFDCDGHRSEDARYLHNGEAAKRVRARATVKWSDRASRRPRKCAPASKVEERSSIVRAPLRTELANFMNIVRFIARNEVGAGAGEGVPSIGEACR